CLYKGIKDTRVKLKGTGFLEQSAITVKLNGNIDYTLDTKYEDESTYQLLIPADIAVGDYNVEITIDGKKTVLQNGFAVIVQGNEKKTSFGPYVFTSTAKIKNADGSYTLRGAVELNGWLRFKGDVVLDGDIEQGSFVRVLDAGGSYVEFDENSAEGLGKTLAKKGISLNLPALQEFTLYNDPAHAFDYREYQADDISIGLLKIHEFMFFDGPTVRLYPNSIGLYYKTGTTILPMQDKIFHASGVDEKLFDFELDGSAQITNNNIGIVLEASYKDPDKKEFSRKCNFMNAPVYFNGSFKTKINTLKDEYMVGAMVRFALFADESGLGAEISWKDGLRLDAVKISLELKEALKLKAMIPIEVNKFTFQGSGLEDPSLLKWKYTGSLTLSSCKVKEYIPALEKFLGDISLFEMPDTTASIRFSPFQIEFSAKLTFLSEITLAEAEAKIGNFSYTNELLDLDSVDVSGFSESLKAGFAWSSANGRVKVDASGTGELDAHSRFVGICHTGTVGMDIHWWMINEEASSTGRMAIGFYTTHEGKKEFVLVRKYQDISGKIRGGFYYIDENGHCGKERGFLN
ncbi:MAG: VWA domain-containing protein, partial [Lachnospiraceae bacterium]|nr:VWA domain-containing protein [Lachnospiraceae bacterium]